MNFLRHGICAALALSTLGLFGGCDSLTTVKQENQQLREVILKQEKENRKLMAQLEAQLNRPEGMDPAERARLELQRQKLEQQLAHYRKALEQLQGKVVLSERLQAKLQALADELGGELVDNKLLLPCDYFFGSGRYEMMPEGRKKLERFAEVLLDENLMLMIVGHTDSDPIKNLKAKGITTNRQLSLMRALTVLENLRAAGYPQTLMYPTGWGDLKPVSGNASKHDKQLNRRVEIYVDPAGSGLMDSSAIMNVNPSGAEAVDNASGPVVIEN